jgi:hypothetical protein
MAPCIGNGLYQERADIFRQKVKLTYVKALDILYVPDFI